MQSPVELDSIESDALVAKGKLILCLIENSEGQIKARLIAMGNVLFDKHMSIRRDAALHDLWSPVASTAEARIVPARAAAYGRVTESIDSIAARVSLSKELCTVSPGLTSRRSPPRK